MKLLLTAIVVFASVSTATAKLSVREVKIAIIQTCKEEGMSSHMMLAICERESDFGLTLDKNLKGDHGHGHGYFQVDDRYHKAWLDTHNWRDPKVACRYAIKLLRANLKHFKGHWQRAVAAYNCGCGNVPKTGKNWDRKTTHKNYADDVFRRVRKFGGIVRKP